MAIIVIVWAHYDRITVVVIKILEYFKLQVNYLSKSMKKNITIKKTNFLKNFK